MTDDTALGVSVAGVLRNCVLRRLQDTDYDKVWL